MNPKRSQELRDLAMAWWRKRCDIEACKAKIEAKIEAEQGNLIIFGKQATALEAQMYEAARAGCQQTKIVCVEPGVSLVLAWDDECDTHRVIVVRGKNIIKAENLV